MRSTLSSNGSAPLWRHVHLDRTAVNRNETGIRTLEAMLCEQGLDGTKRVVDEMLVIDLIEGRVLDHAAKVDGLHDEYAVVPDQHANAADHAVQLLQVEEHACCRHEGCAALLVDDLGRRLLIEEACPCGYAEPLSASSTTLEAGSTPRTSRPRG